MGEVYRARDTRLDRDVAIKFLLSERPADASMKHRFVQEARAASALNHPNIVALHDIASHDGLDFLVMEYVPGTTLSVLIAPAGMPLDRVTALGTQIASALAAAHAAGIVHRDIKPANIMVTADDTVKVLDFGVATMARRHAASDSPTETIATRPPPGLFVGTVSYMSPEQTRGEPTDGRSDIFSLGCVLYQAATGRSPFQGASTLATVHEISTATPLAPSRLRPDLPGEFDALIARCLEKLPEARFVSMNDLAFALRRVGRRPLEATVDVRPSISAIAVLPFVNVGGDPENEYFGDGLAEELITGLGRIDALRVTARSSAFAYRRRMIDARAIGHALNVDAVLEGSVRRSGNRLRIAVQLVNVADGYHLWSERYDREITDIFDIQDEMSSTIVEKLRPRLVGETPAPILKRHTEDPEAYGLYLKGRYYWERRPAGTARALECFKQAIEHDPQYALAHSGLADAYNTLASWEGGVVPPSEGFPKGLAYAEQALRLNPDLAEGHAALAYALLHHRWDLGAAERSFMHAIQLNPRYGPAHHWYSHLLIADGRLEESLSESLAYLTVDPADQFSLVHMAWHYLMTHEFDKAAIESRRALQDEPAFAWHHVFHGWALLNSGAHTEAEAEMRRGLELSGAPNVILTSLIHAQAVAGRREEAMRGLEQLTAATQATYVSPYEIGVIHEALGDLPEAFRWWERAYEERSPWLVYLSREHRLRHLHGDPQFEALIGRIRRELRGVADTGALTISS